MTTPLRNRLWLVPCLLACAIAPTAIIAQDSAKHQPADKPHAAADHIMVVPSELKWTDAPPSLPPGAKVSVLEGDPALAGPFTMRLKLPAKYEIPAHFHPQIEHVTVISGKFNMGTGDKLDKSKGKEMPPGAFAVMAIGTRHFAWTGEETVVQVHGIGPWGITYVDPATDPRKSK